MASPEDAFAFQKRKLIRAGLPVFGRDRDKPGDGPIMIGDEDGLAVAHLFNQGTELIFGGGYRGGFHWAIIATLGGWVGRNPSGMRGAGLMGCTHPTHATRFGTGRIGGGVSRNP